MGHDIIVVGVSSGGLKVLTSIARELPPDLAAAVCIVQHLPPSRDSLLPQILNDVSALPAAHPSDGDPIRTGHLYVAPPDYHMLLSKGRIRIVRGPQENRFRPSIDVLFRSAARTFGPRVVGVVLTGALDDGTVGLQAIAKRGGITAVQDPAEAEYPSMPRSALRFARPDYTLHLSEIPDFLVRMSKEPAPAEKDFPPLREMDIEARIAEQEMSGHHVMNTMSAIGSDTPYTCPTCGGNVWQIGSGDPVRFRCHTGHAFTIDSLLEAQDETLEQGLYSALRLIQEKASIYDGLANRFDQQGSGATADKYRARIDELERQGVAIRKLLASGIATRPQNIDD